MVRLDVDVVAARLAHAGFVAASDESEELVECARGDENVLETMVERRLQGEPLAWITGVATFCGLQIRVDRGVYVPRWQSEPLVRAAVGRLPPRGTAIDLCTGSGAIAKVLMSERPKSQVVASELDERAVRCARSNGVDVHHGDLFAPLPGNLEGRVDVVVGVVPYVPTRAMTFLPRDTLKFESTVSYDGGDDGLEVVRRLFEGSRRFLRSRGCVVVEVGGAQADLLRKDLARLHFNDVVVLTDEDGDVRGIAATLAG